MISLSNIFSVEQGHWNLVIMFITLLAIMEPIVLGRSVQTFEHAPVNDAIASSEAQMSYGILMASTIPLLIDTALDYNIIYDKLRWKQYLFGRVPIALTGFLVSVQFFVISRIPSLIGITNSRAESYLFNLHCFKVVLMGSNMFILTSVKPGVFTGSLSSLFTLIFCVHAMVRINMPGCSHGFHVFGIAFSMITFVLVTLVLVYWLYKWYKTTINFNVDDYTCLLYVFIYLICMLGAYVNVIRSLSKNGETSDFSTYTAEALAIVNYLYAFVFIMLTIAPGRIARFEAVIHLVSGYLGFTIDVYVCMCMYICVSLYCI